MGTSFTSKHNPQGQNIGPGLGPYDSPRGWAFSYERGNPVLAVAVHHAVGTYHHACLIRLHVRAVRDQVSSPTYNGRRLQNLAEATLLHKGTSLVSNSAPLGPYSGTMPAALWWPYITLHVE